MSSVQTGEQTIQVGEEMAQDDDPLFDKVQDIRANLISNVSHVRDWERIKVLSIQVQGENNLYHIDYSDIRLVGEYTRPEKRIQDDGKEKVDLYVWKLFNRNNIRIRSYWPCVRGECLRTCDVVFSEEEIVYFWDQEMGILYDAANDGPLMPESGMYEAILEIMLDKMGDLITDDQSS